MRCSTDKPTPSDLQGSAPHVTGLPLLPLYACAFCITMLPAIPIESEAMHLSFPHLWPVQPLQIWRLQCLRQAEAMVNRDQAVLLLQPGVCSRLGGLGSLDQEVPGMSVSIEHAYVENANAVHISHWKPAGKVPSHNSIR